MKTALTSSLLITPVEEVTSRREAAVPAGACLLDFPDAVLAPGLIVVQVVCATSMIAGIVLARHATLATRNTSHFEDFAAQVVNPWTA